MIVGMLGLIPVVCNYVVSHIALLGRQVTVGFCSDGSVTEYGVHLGLELPLGLGSGVWSLRDLRLGMEPLLL